MYRAVYRLCLSLNQLFILLFLKSILHVYTCIHVKWLNAGPITIPFDHLKKSAKLTRDLDSILSYCMCIIQFDRQRKIQLSQNYASVKLQLS